MDNAMEEGLPTCIICLEASQEVKPANLSCTCDFRIHRDCWIEFLRFKQHIECPICHIVIPESPRQRRRRQRGQSGYVEEAEDALEDTRRCVGMCLSCVLIWCLLLIILRAAGVPI